LIVNRTKVFTYDIELAELKKEEEELLDAKKA
jgi:hypothetical protein